MENQPMRSEQMPKKGRSVDKLALAGILFVAIVVALVYVYMR